MGVGCQLYGNGLLMKVNELFLMIPDGKYERCEEYAAKRHNKR